MVVLLSAIAVSFFLPYGTLRQQLVRSYGEERTSRYLNPARFASVLLRLRIALGLFLLVPLAAIRFRSFLAKLLTPFWSALWNSFAHARRRRWGVNPIVATTLALITLVGFIARLQFISQPMRDDESTTTMLYALKPFYIGLSIYVKPNNHLFHTLLVHIFTKIAGTAEWAIRTPALTAGLILVPLTYELVRRFTSTTAALWASALISASSVMVEYSTNARGYTIICCATAVILIAGCEMLRNASPRWFAIFALAASIGCWTIPVFLLPLGGTAMWVCWMSFGRSRRFRRVFWTRLIITGAITVAALVVVYLPPLATSGLNGVLHDGYFDPHDFLSFLSYNEIGFARTWALWTRDLPTWWARIMPIAFFIALAIHGRLRALVICLVSWTILLFIAWRYVTPERTWLVFMPVFLGGAAAAPAYFFDRVFRARRRLLAACAIALLTSVAFAIPVVRNRSILASNQTGVLKSASAIVQYLDQRHIPPSLVFRDPDYDFPLQYYYWRRNRTDAPQADVKSIAARKVTEGWLLVNADVGESFEADVQKFGLQGVSILGTHPFDGSTLYRLSWRRVSPASDLTHFPNGL